MNVSQWVISGVENKQYSVEHVAIGEQLVISMNSDDGLFRFNIIFGHFHSFNLADESYRLKFLYETRDLRQGNGVFWIIEDSPQLKDFHAQGLGLYEGLPFVNYGIYTANDCIDVLCIEPPQVQLL